MTETERNAMQEKVRERFPESVYERLFSALGGSARSNIVFGDPVTRGEATVIPVARIRYGFGFGGGSGTLPQQERQSGEGGGSGGGGGLMGEPVGYIEMRDGAGVRFVRTPIKDAKEILLLGIAAALPLTLLFLLRRKDGKIRHK